MFTVEKIVPWDELEGRVRTTPLLHPRDGQTIYPYEEADITLQEVSYADVAATSLYVLRRNLATQAAIANDLSRADHHPLELRVGLILRDSDTGKTTGFVPPIVEQTAEDGAYVLDGAHRASIGRWLGRTSFTAIYISGIRSDCPSYALPNRWDDIRITEEVPVNAAQKKQYRGSNYRELYRDFSTLNGSRLRESGV